MKKRWLRRLIPIVLAVLMLCALVFPASGATVYSREEMADLLRDTDALVKEYKETHEGWL